MDYSENSKAGRSDISHQHEEKMLRGKRLRVCTLIVRTLNDLGDKELLDAELRKFNIRIA